MIVKSWRDIGKLGYGNGGAADTPWTRQGIFIGGEPQKPVSYGGPGIIPENRPQVENAGQKTLHDYLPANGLCLICHMLREGHDRQMERICSDSGGVPRAS